MSVVTESSWSANSLTSVSLTDDITPGHLSAQEHLEQDDVEANNDSKPVSKRRRLLMKHRVDVPADDVIRSEVNTYLQVKVDDMMSMMIRLYFGRTRSN